MTTISVSWFLRKTGWRKEIRILNGSEGTFLIVLSLLWLTRALELNSLKGSGLIMFFEVLWEINKTKREMVRKIIQEKAPHYL